MIFTTRALLGVFPFAFLTYTSETGSVIFLGRESILRGQVLCGMRFMSVTLNEKRDELRGWSSFLRMYYYQYTQGSILAIPDEAGGKGGSTPNNDAIFSAYHYIHLRVYIASPYRHG